MMRALSSLFLTFLVAECLAGCELGWSPDECAGSDTECQGSTLRRCEDTEHGDWGSYYSWRTEECGPVGECVAPNGPAGTVAFCSSGPKEPICDDSTGYICDGTALLGCNSGYVVTRVRCGACATSGSTCATAVGAANAECCVGR